MWWPLSRRGLSRNRGGLLAAAMVARRKATARFPTAHAQRQRRSIRRTGKLAKRRTGHSRAGRKGLGSTRRMSSNTGSTRLRVGIWTTSGNSLPSRRGGSRSRYQIGQVIERMAWPVVEFRPKKLMRAAMVADVLLAGRERHLARKPSHNAIAGRGSEVKLMQSGHHRVPEYATPRCAVRTISLLLANATQAANMALPRLAIDTDRFNQNGVPVHPAL